MQLIRLAAALFILCVVGCKSSPTTHSASSKHREHDSEPDSIPPDVDAGADAASGEQAGTGGRLATAGTTAGEVAAHTAGQGGNAGGDGVAVHVHGAAGDSGASGAGAGSAGAGGTAAGASGAGSGGAGARGAGDGGAGAAGAAVGGGGGAGGAGTGATAGSAGASGASGSPAGAGGAAGSNAAGSGGTSAQACSGPPGLYADDQCSVLAEGIRLYTPRYPLWSDGSIKTRYVYLPPGSQIDASDADHWLFPVGTKLWKEFRSADGSLRIETRVMEKVFASNGMDAWNYDTYVWSADQKSAQVAVDGVRNALGSGLDVPERPLCTACHNHNEYPRDMVNGFQAIQLNWTGAGVTLSDLIAEGKLANYRADILAAAQIPGRDATETAAFGYLHGNCGHCHSLNEDAPHNMTLLTAVGVPLANQLAWTTTVCVYPHTPTESYATQRVASGNPSNSAVYNRMSVRGDQQPNAPPVDAGGSLDGPTDSIQMPPAATNVTDTAALNVISSWISSLSGCTPN
jgi:hypothetical protein